jgi:hypothetical protein
MTDTFTRNAPDYGEGDGVLGPPGTPVADRFRRMALLMSLQAKSLWNDPGHTLLPWTRPVGAIARELPAYASNRLRNLSPGDPGYVDPPARVDLAGQYVGPKDAIAHDTIPGYVPQQNWQNAVKADPWAGLLGPMQKPAAQQPTSTPGF